MRGPATRGSRRPCPVCGQSVAVSRATEQAHPHDAKTGTGRCTGSGLLVPLYDDEPQPAA